MAKRTKTITVADFVPRQMAILQTLNADGSTGWMFRMHGDEVDAQGNVVTPDVDANFDTATLNKWDAFYTQALKAAKVARGVDDGN